MKQHDRFWCQTNSNDKTSVKKIEFVVFGLDWNFVNKLLKKF